MLLIGWLLTGIPIALILYAYLVYPLLLRVIARRTDRASTTGPPDEWPLVSISLPAYNEEAQIRGAIESLLAIDYPAGRLQLMVISDASSDGTDAIVREFENQGVQLLRMPRRSGKTAAENAAAPLLHGEIVVNTDASIRIRPDALKALIQQFTDPSVGVASGRDVSVARTSGDGNAGEAGYVSYEMRVRALETQVDGIIGASGCFYAIRSELHRKPLPENLSRDFASALIAREHGYRAVSAEDAVCFVPRTASLQREYRRKVRTIARGVQTLYHKRHLMDPRRYGRFSWMLVSHKVVRWAVPWSMVFGLLGLMLLATEHLWARIFLGIGLLMVGLALVGWFRPAGTKLPRIVAVPAFLIAGNVAALHGAISALRGESNPTWEPTRRDVVNTGS